MGAAGQSSGNRVGTEGTCTCRPAALGLNPGAGAVRPPSIPPPRQSPPDLGSRGQAGPPVGAHGDGAMRVPHFRGQRSLQTHPGGVSTWHRGEAAPGAVLGRPWDQHPRGITAAGRLSDLVSAGARSEAASHRSGRGGSSKLQHSLLDSRPGGCDT